MRYEEPRNARVRARYVAYREPLKSIVLMAGKYDVDPGRLVDAFVEAWRNKKSRCGGLTIQRRTVRKESAMFLATKGEEVVSQFPISLDAVSHPRILKNNIPYISVPAPKKASGEGQMEISELQAGMRRVDVKAKVVEIPPRRLVYTKWGGRSYLSNVKISDETGSIRLSLWNHQIDRVHVGDEVEIEKGYVALNEGEPQLRLGRKGNLSVV